MKELVRQLFFSCRMVPSVQSLMTNEILCSLWNDRAAVTAWEIQVHSPCSSLSPSLWWAQAAPSAGAVLFSGCASLLQESSFILSSAASTRCPYWSWMNGSQFGAVLVLSEVTDQSSLGLGQPRTCGQNSTFLGAGSLFASCTRVSSAVCHLPRLSGFCYFPSFFLQLRVSNPSFP